MKKLNPEHIEAAISLINQGPYLKLLSMEVKELGLGYAKMEIDVDTKHHNPFGALHGGVYASIIDTITFWAIYCHLDEDKGFTTLDIKADYLAAIKKGKLYAEGKVIKAGRTLFLSEAKITNDKGKLMAFGTSKLMVIEGSQSMNDAVTALSLSKLPSKFLQE